MFFGSLKSMYE